MTGIKTRGKNKKDAKRANVSNDNGTGKPEDTDNAKQSNVGSANDTGKPGDTAQGTKPESHDKSDSGHTETEPAVSATDANGSVFAAYEPGAIYVMVTKEKDSVVINTETAFNEFVRDMGSTVATVKSFESKKEAAKYVKSIQKKKPNEVTPDKRQKSKRKDGDNGTVSQERLRKIFKTCDDVISKDTIKVMYHYKAYYPQVVFVINVFDADYGHLWSHKPFIVSAALKAWTLNNPDYFKEIYLQTLLTNLKPVDVRDMSGDTSAVLKTTPRKGQTTKWPIQCMYTVYRPRDEHKNDTSVNAIASKFAKAIQDIVPQSEFQETLKYCFNQKTMESFWKVITEPRVGKTYADTIKLSRIMAEKCTTVANFVAEPDATLVTDSLKREPDPYFDEVEESDDSDDGSTTSADLNNIKNNDPPPQGTQDSGEEETNGDDPPPQETQDSGEEENNGD